MLFYLDKGLMCVWGAMKPKEMKREEEWTGYYCQSASLVGWEWQKFWQREREFTTARQEL